MLHFEWDDNKSKLNLRNHGISFEEAQSVFFDENAIEFFDDEHSNNESRFLMLGVSSHLRVLLVCYCYRKEDQVIRIISARKATSKEKSIYMV